MASEPTAASGRWGLHGDLPWRLLEAAVRACPDWLEAPLAAGWAAVVLVLARGPRRAVAVNLAALGVARTFPARLFGAWRVFHEFARATIDGVRVQHGEDVLTWETEGLAHFRAAADGGAPVVILTAHMGSYDAAAAFFSRRMGRTFHAVRRPERDARLDALRASGLRRMEHDAYQTLYNTGENVLAVELLRALADGGIVALQADRAMPGLSVLTVPGPDGAAWALPKGPFMLAMAGRAACLPAFVIRTGHRRYRVCFLPALTLPEAAAGRREAALAPLASAWAAALLSVLRRHPWQWFVFEPAFGPADPPHDTE